MEMPRYKKTNATAKAGINFVRSVVEDSGSLFHKIEQENDLGIDGLIEFVRDERPLNKLVATQIKSGKSYFDLKRNECLIPIGEHRKYWLQYPVPVIGIVFIPLICEASWVDLKAYLGANPSADVVRFPKRMQTGLIATVFLRSSCRLL